jgi:2-phospho-L-lactate guanylyltransferase (CobY/MobA/RfbA family)
MLASADPITICSDRALQGTNALLLPTNVPFGVQYGRTSFHHHQAEARRLNLPLHILNLPRIQFDLDTPADWLSYQRQMILNHT